MSPILRIMVPLQSSSLWCHVLVLVTGRATDPLGPKPLIQTPYQTFFLKLHKEQTLFFYFILHLLDRGDQCYRTVLTEH